MSVGRSGERGSEHVDAVIGPGNVLCCQVRLRWRTMFEIDLDVGSELLCREAEVPECARIDVGVDRKRAAGPDERAGRVDAARCVGKCFRKVLARDRPSQGNLLREAAVEPHMRGSEVDDDVLEAEAVGEPAHRATSPQRLRAQFAAHTFNVNGPRAIGFEAGCLCMQREIERPGPGLEPVGRVEFCAPCSDAPARTCAVAYFALRIDRAPQPRCVRRLNSNASACDLAG